MRHWPGGLDARRVLVAAGTLPAASRRGTQRLAGLRGGAAAAGRGAPASPPPGWMSDSDQHRHSGNLLPSQVATGPGARCRSAPPTGPGSLWYRLARWGQRVGRGPGLRGVRPGPRGKRRATKCLYHRETPGTPSPLLAPAARPGPGSGTRLRVLSPQHRGLLAQHDKLGVFGGCRPCQQGHPAGRADEDKVEHPQGHKPAMLPAARRLPKANQQVSDQWPILEPARRCQWRSEHDRSGQYGW